MIKYALSLPIHIIDLAACMIEYFCKLKEKGGGG